MILNLREGLGKRGSVAVMVKWTNGETKIRVGLKKRKDRCPLKGM